MKNRKTITFTLKQIRDLSREAKNLTISFSELVRRIIDERHDK